ncbi:MAG TPA: glycosyltransferase family 2 protein [Acidimicrobiales bacterium]|nr:glycosyltransferase family 2 protein [Acidimicrobiales bacterium]
MTASLRVQTVLYHSPPGQVRTWLDGVAAAVAQARRAGVVGTVEVCVGDCATPGLDAEEVDRLLEQAHQGGLGPLRYVPFGANLGSAGGHNALFALAPAPDLALVLNPDALLSPQCLVGLVRALEDPAVGIVEPRQIPLEHPKAYDPATGETSWAAGTCLVVRRAVIEATGGFDADTFFLYGDDVDLSWRARLAGWGIRHVPWAVVHHDKRLDAEGRQRTTDVEERYSAEAALLLPWKYGRPDLLEERQRQFLASGLPAHRAGIEAFHQRRAAARLPAPVPGCEGVAHFVGNGYGHYRFSYPRGPQEA